MYRSLQFRILASVSAVFILAFAGAILLSRNALVDITDYSGEKMENSLVESGEMYIASVANEAGLEVESFLKQVIQSTDTLGTIIERTSVGNGGEPLSRSLVKELNRLTLVSNPSISAIYTQFETDGYDGADQSNQGNLEHSSNQGSIEIYWVREDGELVFYSTEDSNEKYGDEKDEFGIREMEWYLCSFDRAEPCLLDPYLYEVSEDFETLMTTYTFAVTDSDGFQGVVGVDVNLPVIQERIQATNSSRMNGVGDLMIVSQRGLLVASTRYPDRLGEPLSRVDADLANIDSDVNTVNGQWAVSIPIELDGVDDHWQVIYSLPEQAVLGPLLELQAEVSKQSQQSIGIMSLVMLVALGIILTGMLVLLRTAIRPISVMSQMMQELSTNEGDLSQTLPDQSHTELAQLAGGFNAFAAKLREMINTLMQEKDRLLKVADDMTHNGRTVNEQSQIQTQQLDSIVTAITEMAASANEVAQLASTTASSAAESNELIGQSQSILSENRETIRDLDGELTRASEQVERVAERSQSINSILDTIRNIAEQTNLLALNAAIEAARAGEQGRGFAVVADEVRNLAARTQESTEEVDGLIDSLQSEVNGAVAMLGSSRERMSASVESSERAVDSLSQAVEKVTRISDDSTQVASAATEQSSVTDEISRMVTEVGDAAEQLAQLAKATSELTQETQSAALRMDDQLNRLKT